MAKLGVALYLETLTVIPPTQLKALDVRLRNEANSRIECVYALVWPNYPPHIVQRPAENRQLFRDYGEISGIPMWGWANATSDQPGDVEGIRAVDGAIHPEGWLLDIEGKWTQGSSLSTLASGVAAIGKPRRATLAGTTSSHVCPDFRSLDQYGFAIEWQNYLDSGEGPSPAVGTQELYRASFVHGYSASMPWQYRARLGSTYGWGKVTQVAGGRATFDSYRRPGEADATFEVQPRAWGWTVPTGKLTRAGTTVGQLMGRAEYTRIRSVLDVTRGFDDSRSLDEWTALAASARAQGAAVRGCSIYIASEHANEDVIVAIAKGAP